jgi:hypothetical protein
MFEKNTLIWAALAGAFTTSILHLGVTEVFIIGLILLAATGAFNTQEDK